MIDVFNKIIPLTFGASRNLTPLLTWGNNSQESENIRSQKSNIAVVFWDWHFAFYLGNDSNSILLPTLLTSSNWKITTLPENHSMLYQDFSVIIHGFRDGGVQKLYTKLGVCMHTAALFWVHSFHQTLKGIHEPKRQKLSLCKQQEVKMRSFNYVMLFLQLQGASFVAMKVIRTTYISCPSSQSSTAIREHQ